MNRASYTHHTHTYTSMPINLHRNGWAVTFNSCNNTKGKNLSQVSKSNVGYLCWELEIQFGSQKDKKCEWT